jgi:hypothetical protein
MKIGAFFSHSFLPFLTAAAGSLTMAAGGVSFGQQWNDFETPPHNYWRHDPADAASRLHARLTKGELKLPASSDPKTFLKAYLAALNVPVESQILVFSKSSLQRQFVNGHNPRALYFNEDTYVGWMPGGMIEVTGIDPVLGGVFYIFKVPDKTGTAPEFDRRESCMGCHAGSPTNFLPGLMVRSLLTDAEGRMFGERNKAHNGGHSAPFDGRWGGWLVSGELKGMNHLANVFTGRNQAAVPTGTPESFLPAGMHLESGSDPAALLLHDHQVAAVNLLMAANYKLRTEMHKMNSTAPVDQREIPAEAMELAGEEADRVLGYLLFADELPLPGPVKGGAAFSKAFAAGRKADAQGRSLKDLNMKTRMLEYRCSYMIDSAAFRGMPASFRQFVLRRLKDALSAEQPPQIAQHLPKEERQAIAGILTATLPEFAALSRKSASAQTAP